MLGKSWAYSRLPTSRLLAFATLDLKFTKLGGTFMRTVPYGQVSIQWEDIPRILAFGLIVSTTLAAVLFSSPEPIPALTMIFGHMQALPVAPHLLTAGGLPSRSACGGGAVTHC